MKSIEKLREYTQDMRKRSVTPGHNPCADEVDGYLDEIEAEIAERYMELPLDADGVPIHVGDELCGYGRPNGGVTVSAVTGWGGVIVTDKGMTCNPAKDGLLWDGQECHHVKPRTLEDVLQDLIDAAAEIHAHALDDDMPDMLDNLIGEYADKVREAVGE